MFMFQIFIFNFGGRSDCFGCHFQTVTNSDLRLQTSDSEQEQERCIRASSFLRHSSFVLRHSSVLYCCVRAAENSHRQGPEVYPSRQARDFEAVTGLMM